MDLNKEKNLASRTLKIGKARIIFVNERLNEIKEAITKQDIRDLVKSGAIKIKPIKGRRKIERRKRRSQGKIRKKIRNRKRGYIIITRKLRSFIKGLKYSGKLAKENYKEIRKKIRNKEFDSLAQLKEYINEKKK